MDFMQLDECRSDADTGADFAAGAEIAPAAELPRAASIPVVLASGGGGGYQASGRPRWALLGTIVLLHIAAGSVLATMRYADTGRDRAERVTTFSVEEPPPPAPPPPEPAQPAAPPPPAQVVAPPPPIQLTRTARLTVAELPPTQSAPVTLNIPAPAAPAAPSEAAPAPIIPPDFNAAQLNNPAPSYPYLSKRAREEGVVVVRVLVDVDGRAKQAEIETSSGHRRLDEVALETVRDRWRFVPASQAGAPREAWVLVPVTFDLS